MTIFKQQLLAEYEISANTANTVLRLDTVIVKLETIGKNTKCSASNAYDKGI
ncbi:hypothetical protein ABIB40_000025 [Pedobacter sp. UYP30]|uniref:hypothetical protein n=1 Tax=Pedobacter sp. UYP30 TaxID=1756400 RepID=UPI00339A8687